MVVGVQFGLGLDEGEVVVVALVVRAVSVVVIEDFGS